MPYVQFPQAIGDLVSGVNTYQFITVLPVVQLIKTGKLRALAVMGRSASRRCRTCRPSSRPDIRSSPARTGPGFLVKAGTPPAVTARLNAAVNKALKTEKVRDALAKLGVDPGGGTPEAFGTLCSAEIVRWTKVIKDANIKITQ